MKNQRRDPHNPSPNLGTDPGAEDRRESAQRIFYPNDRASNVGAGILEPLSFETVLLENRRYNLLDVAASRELALSECDALAVFDSVPGDTSS